MRSVVCRKVKYEEEQSPQQAYFQAYGWHFESWVRLSRALYQRRQGIRFYWLGIFTLLTLCFNMYIQKHGRVDIITCFLSFSKAFCFQVQLLLQYKEDFS